MKNIKERSPPTYQRKTERNQALHSTKRRSNLTKSKNLLKTKKMETKEVKSQGINNKVNTSETVKAGANGIQEKANPLTPNKDFEKEKAVPEKKEAPAPVIKLSEEVKSVVEPGKAETPEPAAIPVKKEERQEIKPEKPALNLESTLKLVEELHRRKIQRDKLLETITTLEAFEVAQQDDSDDADSNHFQGCALTIEDDERRKFSTKNPVIIQAVAQYVNSLCVNRLAEIEAGIIIPA